MKPRWFSEHCGKLESLPSPSLSPSSPGYISFSDSLAYTMAKYGMSMCVLGMAEEFKGDGIAVNALWPRTG